MKLMGLMKKYQVLNVGMKLGEFKCRFNLLKDEYETLIGLEELDKELQNEIEGKLEKLEEEINSYFDTLISIITDSETIFGEGCLLYDNFEIVIIDIANLLRASRRLSENQHYEKEYFEGPLSSNRWSVDEE